MKAVLVIDMPNACEKCPMRWVDSDLGDCCWTIGELYGYKKDYRKERLDDCPLKPLEENYISIDWIKQNIPFQNEEDQSVLLSMLDAWRNK